MKDRKTLTMEVKKVVPWGNGLAVYITKECNKLGWDRKTKLVVYTIEDSEGMGILLRKAPID